MTPIDPAKLLLSQRFVENFFHTNGASAAWKKDENFMKEEVIDIFYLINLFGDSNNLLYT